MERRNNTVSSGETYYFQILPRHLKVEHAYAKNLKPGTSYRLAVNRGFQKVDEFSAPVKAKIMGGKIGFENRALAFSLANFTPTRNIEYTVKVLETRPGEEEKEVAQHKIKSGDYVKKFKGEQTTRSQQEVPLVENLGFSFDVFVSDSQEGLDSAVKQGGGGGRSNAFARKKEEKRESSHSTQRRLSRKRGHDGKLRSREGSEASQSPQHSRSSRRSGRFPHAQDGEHFIRSNKKASPPKVEGGKERKSLTGGGKNLVTAGMRDEGKANRSRTPERLKPDSSKGKKPVHDLEFKNSEKMIDIQKRRGVAGANSPPSNQAPGRSSGVEQGGRVGGAVSPPQGSQGGRSAGRIGGATSPQGSQGASGGRSSYRAGGATSPEQKEEGSGKVHDLVIKGTENVFDIVKRGQQGGASGGSGSEEQGQNLTRLSGQGRGGRGSSGALQRGGSGGASRGGAVGGPSASGGSAGRQGGVSGGVEPVGVTPGQDYEQKPIKTGGPGSAVKPQPPERSVKSRDSKQAPTLVKTKLQPSVKTGTAEIGVRKSREIAEVQEQKKEESSQGSDTLFYVVFILVSSLLFWNAITPTSRV